VEWEVVYWMDVEWEVVFWMGMEWEVVYWMDVAQNRYNWRAVVYTVRIFGLRKMRKNFGFL
jgi:hypothetical protein